MNYYPKLNKTNFIREGRWTIYYNDEQEKDVSYFALVDYYPKNRYAIIPKEEEKIRSLVYEMKNGQYRDVALLAEMFGSAIVNKFTITQTSTWNTENAICIIMPASTQVKTNSRFKNLCSLLAKFLYIKDGFNVVTNIQDSEPAHTGHKVRGDISQIGIDYNLIKEKLVIIVDDVYTSGKSFKAISKKLLKNGADNVIGVYLGKTWDSFEGEPYFITL